MFEVRPVLHPGGQVQREIGGDVRRDAVRRLAPVGEVEDGVRHVVGDVQLDRPGLGHPAEPGARHALAEVAAGCQAELAFGVEHTEPAVGRHLQRRPGGGPPGDLQRLLQAGMAAAQLVKGRIDLQRHRREGLFVLEGRQHVAAVQQLPPGEVQQLSGAGVLPGAGHALPEEHMHIERQLPDRLEAFDHRAPGGAVLGGQPEVVTVVVEPGQSPVADGVQQRGGSGGHGHGGCLRFLKGSRPPPQRRRRPPWPRPRRCGRGCRRRRSPRSSGSRP